MWIHKMSNFTSSIDRVPAIFVAFRVFFRLIHSLMVVGLGFEATT